jgi:hypothetical protein
MITSKIIRFFSTAALVVGFSTVVHAQATRTWVSGVGDDVNPCSRTAPCKTFAGAISKTMAGGEINALDPAGYGAVTITKSMTIDCEDTQGSILASSTFGVTVNGAGVIVTLRGLSISGAPPTSPGAIGVRFLQGAALNIEKCRISYFNAASPNGFGIQFASSTSAKLMVSDTTISNNGAGATGGGIQIAGTSGVNAALVRTQVINNAGVGIIVDGTGGGSKNAVIQDCQISANSGNGVTSTSTNGNIKTIVTGSTISSNSVGLNSTGAQSTVLVGGSTITANLTGVSTSAGTMQSMKNNFIAGNGADGTPIAAFPGPGGTALQ